MIHHISQKITDFFNKNNIIDLKEYEICTYGLELIISSVIGASLILMLGILFFGILESLVFLLFFISLRSYTGGYHAQNYVKCNLVFVISFLSCLLTYKMFNCYLLFSQILSLALLGFSLLSVLIFAPIENSNKPITNEGKRRCKELSIAIVSIECVIILVLMMFRVKIFMFMALTIFWVGMTIVIEIIKRRCNINEKDYTVS